jgi:hypothetical protein
MPSPDGSTYPRSSLFSGLGFPAVKDGDDALSSSFNYYFLDYSFGHSRLLAVNVSFWVHLLFLFFSVSLVALS